MKSCSESRPDWLLLFGEGFGGRGEEVRAATLFPTRLTRGGGRKQETEGGQRSSEETTQKTRPQAP